MRQSPISFSERMNQDQFNSLIYVSDELDLVDVAIAVANDDKASVEQWMQINQVSVANDAQAKRWHAEDATLWAVVIRPFVLVQENTQTQTY